MKATARLWMAIGKPPPLGIDGTMAKIHGKLAEVNSEAMIQLHKRSQKIHITVEDNNAHIKKLETSNSELERLNGVLARSLERLEEQHRKFVREVEGMSILWGALLPRLTHGTIAITAKNGEEDKQRLEIFKEALSVSPCDPSGIFDN